MNCGAVVSGDTGAGTIELLARASTSLSSLLSDELADEFVVERELGRGGMAAVFLAKEIALDRSVAIKVLPPELTFGKGMVERFIREARTAANLGHPHIIPIYRVSPSAGRLFWYCMKYVEGTDFGAVLEEVPPLGVPRALRILDSVAQALDYGHRHGVIHRDVKPANVMLTETDWVYVTDFGIAKALGGTALTGSGGMIGTPHYMSPEQCRGQPVTAAADQYSLAVMAYQTFGGKVPFTGESVIDIVTQHATVEPPALAMLRPDLPTAASDVVQKGMAKDPAARFGSTREFIQELRDALSGEDIGQRTTEPVARITLRPPRPRAAGKSRRWRWFLMPVVVLLAVLGGLMAIPATRSASLDWVRSRFPQRRVTPPPVSEPIRVPPPTALLRVAVSPPTAQVTIDDQLLVGDTMTVLLGDVTLRAQAAGYRDTAMVLHLSIPGEVRPVPIPLQREPPQRPQSTVPAVGYLRVRTNVVNAEVEVNGQLMSERTPATYVVAPGLRHIIVKRAGYTVRDTIVTITPGDTTYFKPILRREVRQ